MLKTHRTFGRPTFAEIDLSSLEFNYRQVRKRVPVGVKLLAVVKADAYGHGAIPVSRKLERLGVTYLGVAISDEGVELRQGGVKAPILILGGTYKEDVDQVLRYDLTPVVFQKESLKLLMKAAERWKKRIRVHIKVDTGMGRLGVPLNVWPAFLKELKRFPRIEVEGILSHFSMADGEAAFTAHQWREFQRSVALAEKMGISPKYLHMASSAILTACPSYCGNLARPGIMLYGSHPSPVYKDLISLKPVLTLKTHIHFLKAVPPGTKIGYGGTFVTKRDSLIATLPVGYADGYSRGLSNQGEVLIRGKRAPVIGRVCMDFIMVDVTHVPKVALGDEAVLMGRQGRQQITAEEIAGKINSISYEVLCLIGKRVPRVYKE